MCKFVAKAYEIADADVMTVVGDQEIELAIAQREKRLCIWTRWPFIHNTDFVKKSS